MLKVIISLVVLVRTVSKARLKLLTENRNQAQPFHSHRNGRRTTGIMSTTIPKLIDDFYRDEAYETLNESQQKVAEVIIGDIMRPASDNKSIFWLDGPGGAGKTYVTKFVMNWLRSLHLTVLTCAYSAVAAKNLDQEGTTCHSAFRIVVGDKKKELRSATEICSRYPDVRLVIIDEVSMISADFLGKIMTQIGKAYDYDITILCVGDFHQIPPVAGKGLAEACCFNEPLAEHPFSVAGYKAFMRAKRLTLNKSERATGPLVDLLNNIREQGRLSKDNIGRIPILSADDAADFENHTSIHKTNRRRMESSLFKNKRDAANNGTFSYKFRCAIGDAEHDWSGMQQETSKKETKKKI